MRALPPLILALITGCSYGWEIGAPAGSGGAGTGTGGADCASLLASLETARAQAKACTLGVAGQCATSIPDECGCASYVTQGGSAAATAFASAVAAVKDAHCATACGACLPSAGACLINGGKSAACVP